MRAIDPRIDRYRRRHLGLLTAGAAREFGLAASTIRSRVRAGKWRELQPQVYVDAGVPDGRALRLLAAVLAVDAATPPSELRAMGRVTALSRVSAAAHLLPDLVPHPDRIHVTTNGRGGTRVPGAVVHRTGSLTLEEVVTVRSVPTIHPRRTVCEAAGMQPYERTLRFLAELTRRGDTDPTEVAACLRSLGRIRGAADVRRACAEVEPWEPWSRSAVESAFARGVVAHGLPRPRLNHPVIDVAGRRRYIDAAFLPECVPVEIQSRRWHGLGVDADRDALRERSIVLSGWRSFLRFTYWDVMRRMDAVAEVVALALEAARRDQARSDGQGTVGIE